MRSICTVLILTLAVVHSLRVFRHCDLLNAVLHCIRFQQSEYQWIDSFLPSFEQLPISGLLLSVGVFSCVNWYCTLDFSQSVHTHTHTYTHTHSKNKHNETHKRKNSNQASHNSINMFSLVNGIYDSYLAPTQLNLLVVGPPGVGKTALLERLKATALPRRPRKPPSLSLDALPQTLEQAFQPPGAPSETKTTTATPQKTTTKKVSSSSSSSNTVSPSPSSVVVTQARRRGFALICPAPERYRNSKDDQDEEFVQDHNDDEPPPMITRSHSKEFSMDEISDIIGTSESQDAAAATPQSTRTPTKLTKAITIMEESPSLLQSNFEEVDRKPKAKMLPLSKITPTSKCFVVWYY
jgi:GTPase SAR1 family protein